MPSDTPTNPEFRIPSAAGIVAVAGKQPEPEIVAAIRELWGEKPVRDAIANGLFWLVTRIVPGAAQSIALKQLEPHIMAIIETGSK